MKITICKFLYANKFCTNRRVINGRSPRRLKCPHLKRMSKCKYKDDLLPFKKEQKVFNLSEQKEKHLNR